MPAIEYITTNTRPYIQDGQNYRFKERCTVLRVASLFADAILNCCEKEVHPDEYYKFKSSAEVSRAVEQKSLYNIKRSSRHLMNQGIDMVSTS